MNRMLRTLAIALALGPAAALAQAPATLPPGVFAGERDIALATAGTYTLDEQHTAVIVRVSHIGYSQSVFRFDRAKGSLTWDPAAIETSKLSASVETASITTNVKGFAEELAGDNFLKSKAFPEATFVSTSFKPVDRTRGRIEGQFTLMARPGPSPSTSSWAARARASRASRGSASMPLRRSTRRTTACRRCSPTPSRSRSTPSSRGPRNRGE